MASCCQRWWVLTLILHCECLSSLPIHLAKHPGITITPSCRYCAACVQILICQNLRNNLQHPNEYIRGVTLRFLCRIREEEILEPLIPSILACLEHRHSYVRRNAVLAINALYRLPRGELLLQDAPELIEKVHNLICKESFCTQAITNAFLEHAGRV